MPEISRAEFLIICLDLISKTRKEITIINQRSGYIQYHKEVKEDDYIGTLRDRCTEFDDELYESHAIIKEAGVGHCYEVAVYLGVEIAQELGKRNIEATVSIVASAKYDHVYNRILIKFKNEKGHSLLEFDAWDPRIIDITTRENGTIKNEESLLYGTKVIPHYEINTLKVSLKKPFNSFFFIKKPEEGRARSQTPEREMLEKHKGVLYKDKPIEEALKRKKISSSYPHFLQKASKWQKMEPEPEKIKHHSMQGYKRK